MNDTTNTTTVSTASTEPILDPPITTDTSSDVNPDTTTTTTANDELSLQEAAAVAVEQTGHHPGDVFSLDVDDILYEPSRNQRFAAHTSTDIKKRAKSILEYGQIQPAGVIPVISADGVLRWRLEWGVLRFLGVRHNVESGNPMQLRVEWWDGDPSKLTAVNIRENSDRVALSPMDRAKQVTTLKGEGRKGVEIAAIMGVDQGLVSKLANLVELPPEAQEAIHVGVVPQTIGFTWAGLKGEDREKVIAKQLKKLIAEGVGKNGGKGGKAKGGGKSKTKVRELQAEAAEATGQRRARSIQDVMGMLDMLISGAPEMRTAADEAVVRALSGVREYAGGDSAYVEGLMAEWGIGHGGHEVTQETAKENAQETTQETTQEAAQGTPQSGKPARKATPKSTAKTAKKSKRVATTTKSKKSAKSGKGK